MEINRTINELKLAEEFPISTEFSSIAEFDEAFIASALEKGIRSVTSQRNAKSIALKCKEPTCNFKVSARYIIKKSKCVVKTMNPFHSCSLTAANQRQRSSVKKLGDKINITNLTPKLLIEKMRTEYQYDVSYQAAWSAIKTAKKNSGMLFEDAYSYIPSLVESIRRNGDFAEYTCSQNRSFERFFMLWGAAKDFFPKSRKLLYLDGTFLAGPNKGTLLVAVSQDSCDQLVLIAVAIVESENLSSWNWFLNSINMNMPINQKDVIIFSDREKGIINATNAISPLSSKAYCVRHIAKNLRLSFRDKNSMDFFWKAANTYSVQEFTATMESLKHHNPQFYERVASIGVETWANSMFPIPRFSKMTTNPVESMNSALKRFVDQDICSLILSINNYAMQIYNERRQKRFQTSIVDPCLKALNKNILLGRLFTIQPSNSDVYLVDHKYVVNLPNKTCECKEGVDVGIPCRHICAVLRNNHMDPSNFVAKVYLSDTYYSQFLRNILPLSFLTLTRSDITSPIARRSRGRPRIRRIPASFKTN